MIFYRSPSTGNVHAFDTEEERDLYGAEDLIRMTPEEVEAHLNPPYQPTEKEIRDNRDYLLSDVYDRGINMAMRFKRMAVTPEEHLYADAKIQELDLYAEALTNIPLQPGFPLDVQWPTEPQK